MLAVFAVVVAAIVAACSAPPRPTPPTPEATAAADPWSRRASDEPPSFAVTRAIADRACPRVVAPYFYRLEKAGKVSHILGTRHLGVGLDKMPASVRQAMRSAELAVFETVGRDDPPDVPYTGAPLPQQLGPELWSRYRALVGRVNADTVERLSPASAAITVMALYEYKFAALDAEIEREVTALRIPTHGLETSAFQLGLIDELFDIRMLKSTLAGVDRASLERDSATDLAEYCAGTDDDPGIDPEGRKQLLAGGLNDAEIDRIDARMVYDRNADWIPKLERLMASGGAFVAVGADHLPGPRGVIALLAARGWTTVRVRP